jgi:DNA-binding transcriptional LysR family regulator
LMPVESVGCVIPRLSAGIKQLEEALGVQLIFRGARYGGLTPEGVRALVWARKLVGDTRAFREEMRVSRHGLSGHLRLAVIPTALTWAAILSAHFAQAHPKVRFTILSRTSTEVLKMLENLEVDAGLSYIGNEPLGRMTTAPIYTERYMLVCHADNPLALQSEVTWADLAAENLCLLTPDMQNRRIINQCFMEADVTPDALVEANSTLVLAAIVEQGGWVTVLPGDMARFLAAGKGLAVVPIAGAHVEHKVGLVAPHRQPHTPVLEALLRAAQGLATR